MQNCETILEPQVESVSERFYQIADRVISVQTDSERGTGLAEAFLSGLHLSPLAHSNRPAHLRLRISTHSPPALPTEMHRFPVPGGLCYKNHSGYYLEIKGSRVSVGAKDSNKVEVWLADSRHARELITVMAYAVPAALRRIGLFDLHAAALIEPKSRSCFVFPGTSQSGKTSMSIRLAASGWHYLSDDVIVISEAKNSVEVRGLRRPFQSSADSLAGCELPRLEDALGVTIPNDPEKRRLEPEVLFPGQFASSAQPVVLCFPMITGEGESRLAEITRAGAMSRLIDMCPWANYDKSSAREHLRVLSELVRQCKTFILHAGRDIFDNPREASVLLSRLI